MNQSSRILIIRPSALGDVFRSVPLAVSIERAFPGVSIDWVVQEEFLDAVRGHPSVRGVLPFPRTSLRGWWRGPRGWRRLLTFTESLRGGYDVVVDAQGLGRSGFMSLVSGGRRRIGYADARELGWVGLNERIRVSKSLHAVDRMLELLRGAEIEPVCDLSLYVPGDVEEGWDAWKASVLGGGSYVALAPTSRWKTKEWPMDRWIDLARNLVDAGHRIVVLGSGGERSRLSAFEGLAEGVHILAGSGPLAWSMAAVRDADLIVANDSAMLHAAVGFERPLVGLFGPTDPTLCGPYGRLADCIRAEGIPPGVHYRDRGLDDGLMRGISLQQVVSASYERLNAAAGGRR